MFKNRINNYQYDNMEYQRLYFLLEESERKLKNLNNRLRRVENFLGLRNEDKEEKE